MSIDEAVHVWVMDTDQEIVLPDTAALTEWLRAYREDALAERPLKSAEKKRRFRELFEWE